MYRATESGYWLKRVEHFEGNQKSRIEIVDRRIYFRVPPPGSVYYAFITKLSVSPDSSVLVPDEWTGINSDTMAGNSAWSDRHMFRTAFLVNHNRGMAPSTPTGRRMRTGDEWSALPVCTGYTIFNRKKSEYSPRSTSSIRCSRACPFVPQRIHRPVCTPPNRFLG